MAASERISNIFEVPFEVVEEDIDAMNHVNNLVYLKWSNRAAGLHTKSVGWTRERLLESGAVFMVRSHNITYRKQALLGDKVLVRTWIDEMTNVSANRKFEIRMQHDQSLVANGNSVWVFVDIRQNRLAHIPDEISAAFARTD